MLRTKKTTNSKVAPNIKYKFFLPYQKPYDFEGLFGAYEKYRIGNLEWFENSRMHRLVSSGKCIGEVTVWNEIEKSSLGVEIKFHDESLNKIILAKVRRLFDLDCDPQKIAKLLKTDKPIHKLLKLYPGIRFVTGWDAFETGVSTILGQLVSVERARALTNDLIEIANKKNVKRESGHKAKLFPSPQEIINADLSLLKTTRVRKGALIAFSKAVHDGFLSLEENQDAKQFISTLLTIKGIGPWTAEAMALKVLKHPDTFPLTDLILARAVQIHPIAIVKSMSPYQSYVASLFWRHYAKAIPKVVHKPILKK